MIVWLLLLLVLVIWIVNFRVKRRRMYELASLIPKPKGALPVIGVAHMFLGNTENLMDTLKKFSYLAIQHNGLAGGWFGPFLYFVLTNPVDLEVVLKTCLEKDDLHRFLRKMTGQGSIFAPVSCWRGRRKYTVPVFSPKNLENFIDILSAQSEKLAKILESKANNGVFSVWPFLTGFTLDSVFETTMGVTINAQGNPDSPFLKSVSRILHLICERISHLWLYPDWIYSLFPQYQEHEKCLHIMKSFLDKVIAQRRDTLELNGKTEADNPYDLGNYRTRSFLDLLMFTLGRDKGCTNTGLRDEVLTFVVAGTDTSAVAIGNVLKVMAKYPQVQEKLHEELDQVFGDSDRPLVKDDLIKLKYMERVIKETIRLFPPVPFVIRKILEEITLPSGRTLPAGSGVFCSILGVHRDPRYWGPNAEHFDPDRFLPENYNLPHACCYMPFSNGPRNCVGYQYALMTAKIALAAVFRRFKVVEDAEQGPIPNLRFKLEIMMKTVDDYEIALKRRVVDTKK